jgi:hypothetical protein
VLSFKHTMKSVSGCLHLCRSQYSWWKLVLLSRKLLFTSVVTLLSRVEAQVCNLNGPSLGLNTGRGSDSFSCNVLRIERWPALCDARCVLLR